MMEQRRELKNTKAALAEWLVGLERRLKWQRLLFQSLSGHMWEWIDVPVCLSLSLSLKLIKFLKNTKADFGDYVGIGSKCLIFRYVYI